MAEGNDDAILGSWLSAGSKIRLDIRREGGVYRGSLVEGVNEDILDCANPDPALRGRKVLGLDIMTGLEARDGKWKGGKIYDPESGKSFSLELSLPEPGRLRMRGYIGLPFIGISQAWTRLDPAAFAGAEAMAAEAGLAAAPEAWSADKARAYMAARPWPVGCNFIPSTAINELEMWQGDSFDPETIARELDLAKGLGFNCVRVYLHYLPWRDEGRAFLDRISRFLDLASDRGISTLFVLFDDCWNDNPRAGKQPAPKKGVHNSGWVRCPGTAMIDDESSWPALEDYESSVISAFAQDRRVLGWDLYNEIGNSVGFRPNTTRLLARSFLWARRVAPSQPMTAGIWRLATWYEGINRFLAERSDILSFHQYDSLETMGRWIRGFEAWGKPMLCTEYMARSQGNRFETHLPVLKEKGIGAINWGLVAGKTNTIYPWGSRRGAKEPETWFHDIYRPDGSPWSAEEVAAIRRITEA